MKQITGTISFIFLGPYYITKYHIYIYIYIYIYIVIYICDIYIYHHCFHLFYQSLFTKCLCVYIYIYMQLDIALWHTKLCFHVQIEHSTRMSHCC